MDLSIIIPAYNESHKIQADIAAAADFLTQNNLTGEIIVSDDGSTDNTAETAEKAYPQTPAPAIPVRIIRSQQNRGKGHAIRSGVEISRGQYVLFADSGNCIPYSDALKGLELLRQEDCHIAHASRKLPNSQIRRPQPLFRRACSRGFRFFERLFMGTPSNLTDTQCGFKIYRGQIARELYKQCRTDGFMFDVEIVLRAHLAGYNIREFPISWSCDQDSRLLPIHYLPHMLAELTRIRRTLGMFPFRKEVHPRTEAKR